MRFVLAVQILHLTWLKISARTCSTLNRRWRIDSMLIASATTGLALSARDHRRGQQRHLGGEFNLFPEI